ncbi:uncharacterized protein [Argopecten irradians]|uniref:uncharacterized protein isoform X1 n=1 Tax=Argopecten irradians TaxID=31199 RepID=UPI00371818F3
MNAAEKAQERQRLSNLITQWNQDHYDLFELSQPNEECEFHGVVRFYFQDGANVVTKCIRVASSATAGEVIEVLVEKFRPDMRMLTTNKYALFEVHANGEDRRIMFDEKILYVQLTWGKDVREGRFLMRREGAEVIAPEEKQQFKRNLSKREKKEKKKQEKQNRGKENKGAAEKLYTDMPESKFTRSISNPDAVMRRRRQQKVEKKLQQCRDKHGQGGTLKIYGDTLKPDIPYKTLLLSTSDTVAGIVKEAMEKYGLENEDTEDFCLVQVIVPPEEQEYHGGSMGEERIMDDSECPLFIAMEFPPARGTVLFQLKRRSPDQLSTKHKKLRAVSHDDLRSHQRDEPDTMPQNKLPYLIELHPDGSDNPNGRIHQIHRKFTDVGSDKSTAVIFVKGTNIQPRHCVLGLSPNDGIVLVTPTNTDSETYVNNQRVYETTKLQNGNTLRLGKLNYFRFIDPIYEERLKKGQVLPSGPIQKHGGPYNPKPQETNFDVDGKVETMADNSPRSNDQPMHGELQKRSQSVQNMGPPREPERPPPQRRIDEALPAALEYREEKEDGFLTSVILDNNSGTQFKLAPTYTIYMALRYTLSNNYRPDLSPSDRANKVTILVSKVSKMILQAIQSNCDNPATLAFWMANASEVLHFFKQDHDIHPFSMDAQETLAESVQMAFHHLVRCLQYDLQRTMPAFLDESEAADDDMMQDDSRYNRGKPTLGDVLDTLSSAMNLLRRCRVNAALTIQLFSQLFHFLNMWLFNIMVTGHHSEFCTRSWGVRLKRRLGRIEAWAEKQGLELAADCHLCRIIQAAHLLQAPKASSDDIADISSTCFKLNSLQLQELLQRYMPEPGEPPIPHSLIESVVSIAQNMADDLTKNDGREVQLEEDSDLQLPFLLPEDGYSCDTVRNIPNGLADFIEPFARAGLCRMVAQPASRGEWTVYMTSDEHMVDDAVQRGPSTPQPPPNAEPRQLRPQLPKEPEVMTVTFNKVNGSMGLSIVAAKGEGQKERGIYIKSVVQGGAAALDKRLQAGDQLLEVDGKSLIGLTQEKAAELMTRTGQTVSLKVAKQGAFFHGLANLLSQPSPVMQRAASPKKSSRPQEEGPPPYNGSGDMDRGRHGPGHRDQRQVMNTSHSRSSPSLNKYRHGMSHKDMENIYGRKSALWRSILEADLREVKAKASEKKLEELKENANNRNNKVMSLDRRTTLGQMSAWDEYVRAGKSQSLNRNHNGQIHNNNYVNGGPGPYTNGHDLQPDEYYINGYADDEMEEKKKDLRVVQKELKKFTSQGLGPSGVKKRIRSKSIGDLTDLSRSERRKLENAILDRYQNKNNAYNNEDQQSQDILRSKSAQMLSKSNRARSLERDLHANGHNSNVKYNNYVNKRPGRRAPPPRPRSVGSIAGLIRDPNNNHVKNDEYNRFKNSSMILNSSSIPSLDYGSSSVISSSQSYGSAVFSGPQYDQNTSRSSSLGYASDPSRHGNERGSHSRHSLAAPPSDYRDQYADHKPRLYSDSSNGRGQSGPFTSSHTFNGSVSSSNTSLRGRPGGNFITRNPRSKHITSAQQYRDGMGSDRMKATSTGNLRDPQMSQVQPPNHHERIMHPRDMRDPGLMSKSIPNLRMDNSFDSREHQQGPPQQMRPAASVGALQHDYYNHSMDRRGDPRAHDYENQQNLDPRLRNAPEPGRMDRGYPEAAQSLPPNIGLAGGRGPPSSRNSQSSFRDERPRSEYFGHPAERPDLREERPRSMEINANKIHEWQQKYNMDDHHSQPSPHERSFEGRDPNYVNTSRSPPHSSPGYVNSGDIPKMSANNEARQPNFYENTVPRQTEPQPAFHQMRKPQMDHPPQTAPKPMVATKPASRVMPVDIPRVEADNRHSQPHFFDPRTQQGQASPKPMNQSSYMAGQPHMVHSPGFNDPRNASLQRNQKFPQGREMYNHHQSPELPPAPLDIPPELPPPPAGMDMDDDLPPLPPPPPAQDYRPDPRDDMDPPYANQGDPRFSMPPSSYSSYNAPHQQSNYSQHHFQDPRQDHSMMAYSEPQRHPPPQQLPPAKPQHIHPQSYQPNHDYQNISYEGRSPNRSFESPPQHSPNQNVYEPYENKSASLPPGVAPQGYMPQAPMKNTTMPRNMAAPQQFTSQSKNRLVAEMSERTKDGKPLSSAWDRDEKERIEKEQQIDMKKARDAEISDLESRSYLSPQEQDRLRKLRLEQEFQRRVQEVEGREEEEEDSDHDISNNTQTGREYMINALKEDIVKAQKRLEDYNRKRMFEEMDKEKERKAVLERKLEMFEREKEERQERLRQRQEKRQREQEEKLQKLKESREKQRQEYEEQKRLMIAEEEKNRARKMEEIQRRKDIEREQKRKAQEARDAEEKVLRAEARRREEEFQRQQQEQRDRERREANREITVTDERKRLEVLTVQTQQQQQYQPYANLPSQYSPPDRYTINVPPPPTRGSSYEAANRSNGGGPNSYEAATRSNPSMVNSYNGYKSHSPAGRGPPEPAFKKSVKFNTQLETQINTYNEDQGRGNSVSSYRSSVSDQHSPSSPSINSPALDNNSNAFVSTPQQNHVDQKYCTTENTPTVIGAQEVYRDPRNRINAQKDFIVAQPYKKGQEKMSFKDKMKFFAAEAGEETPKYKPKASKTLRNIESQLHNGQ